MGQPLRITLLAGGVGGAKMAEGLAGLGDVALTVIGNVADDEEFHGLWVSPDIDTMIYSLSGRVDRGQGWGVADDGHRALEMLGLLGQDCWMSLGDRDLGLHIWRTMRLARGDRPSAIAADAARALGVGPRLLLPTDDRVQTRIGTDEGWMSFQEYFVARRCRPEVRAIEFRGIAAARPTPEALAALAGAEVIVIAPSNPLVSIAPILAVPGIEAALRAAGSPRIAVSPFIAGKVVKGPADRMMASLGLGADVVAIARHYRGLADTLVIDHADAALAGAVAGEGVTAVCRDILMRDEADKRRLAAEIVAIATHS